MAAPVRAFLSYAHEDHAWRDRVLNHLGWLRNSGQLQAFDDRQIKPGEQWDPRIRAELESASIIIVLISEHFVGSHFCTIEELVRAVERQRSCTADLIAIYCDWVDLGALPVATHQVVPQDETNDLKPLAAWGEKEASLPLSRIAAAVRGMVEARRPKSATPAEAAAGAGVALGLPPRGRFVGRETDLDQLRAWILDDAPQPIIALGPGGIGKSKLTIAALHDPAVAGRFADRRYFVPLHDVRDEAGVYGAVAAALGREPGAQPLADVIAALAGEPALLVLDNAESPWEVDRTGAEQAFARLAELPGTSLVVSLRGFELPGTADWRPILVQPLPPDPATSLFLAIAGDRYAADPALPTVLARLDGLPLAIELVAHRARTEPDAATVLRRWDEERSAFLRRGQGDRKDLDLAVSISFSLASPRLTDAGRRLFAVLGRLPHGLARADLPAIMPRDGTTAANTLAQTGLVLPDPERLRMLAPVREHAAEHTPGDAEAIALAAHYSALADMLRYLDESSYDRDAALRARVELPNIEAVLPRRTTDPASWALGWRWIRVGDTRRTLGSLGPALAAYEIARDCFAAWATVKAAEPGNARWQRDLFGSWERLGDVRTTQGDLPGALQAYAEAKNIADKLAAADLRNAQWQRPLISVLWRVGYVKQLQGNIADALISLQAGHRIIAKLAAADPRNARWQSDLSSSWYKLGDVLRAQGDLEGVLQAYTEAMKISAKLAATDPGNAEWQHGVAVSWERLGNLAESQGDLDGALKAYLRNREIVDWLASTDPLNAQWQRDRIDAYSNLAKLLERMPNRAAEAVSYWSESLALARALADTGRLAPTDTWLVDILKQRLAAARDAADRPP